VFSSVMRPVNRNEAKRPKSSESEFTLVEFMKVFPDDATCLEWLWRNRYSEDGLHADCPKCDRTQAFERYATAQQAGSIRRHRLRRTCRGLNHHSDRSPATGHHLLTHTAASPTTEPRLRRTTEQDALMLPSSAGLSDIWRNQD